MTKQSDPQQTVAAAEAVLRDLETKRDECLQHGQELTNVRRAHAYQAHAVHDPARTGRFGCLSARRGALLAIHALEPS